MTRQKLKHARLHAMLSLYYHQVNDRAAETARVAGGSLDALEGAQAQHQLVSLDVSLDSWWTVTGDWRKCPSEVLPETFDPKPQTLKSSP